MAMPKIDPETLKQMMMVVGQSMGGLTPQARVASTPIPRGLQPQTAQATHDSVLGSIADNQRAKQMQIEQQNAKDMLSMKERQLAIDSANTMFEHGMQQKQLDATVEGNNAQLDFNKENAKANRMTDADKVAAQERMNSADNAAAMERVKVQEAGAGFRSMQNATGRPYLDPNTKRSDDRIKEFHNYVNQGEKAMRDMRPEIEAAVKTETDPAVKQAMQNYLSTGSVSGAATPADSKNLTDIFKSQASFEADKNKKKQSNVTTGYNKPYVGQGGI